MSAPDYWNDSERAQEGGRRASELKAWIEPYNKLHGRVEVAEALLSDAIAIQDVDLVAQICKELEEIAPELEELELRRLLADPLDVKDCFLAINAGAGGTESCDWVDILARMYSRWASRRKWSVPLIDRVEGDSAGSKSVTFRFTGPFAFGCARAEIGVHRLVRISPFDANQRRHTSFASVDVTPGIDEEVEGELKPDDLRIDTYRASGAGGQHVNKTDSAVRITHEKYKISVACQSQRSQLQNKETCLKLLKAKVYAILQAERARALQELSPEKREITWGSQIRSYVFQPYTLIKDMRTRHEIGNIQAVLDGDIDPFIYAYLKLKRGEATKS